MGINVGGLDAGDATSPASRRRQLPRLRDRVPVHPGLAVRVDQRGQRGRARRRDRLPESPRADPDAARRAAAREPLGRDGRGARLVADLPGGRVRRRPALRGRARSACSSCCVLALLIALAFASIGRVHRAADRAPARRCRASSRCSSCSCSCPRARCRATLIEQDWFRTIATYNPVSYLFEGLRSLIIFGWQGKELALGLRVRGGDRADRRRRLGLGPADAAGADMRRFFDVADGRRLPRDSRRSPPTRSCCCPSLIFPLFFFVAFAGGLSSVGDVPGFDFPSGYTAFQFVFVLLQASAFGGVFTGLRDRVRLRERLLAADDAGGAEPARHPRRLRARGDGAGGRGRRAAVRRRAR